MFMIADNLWNEIENLIPPRKSKFGRPAKDPKITLSGIFYIMITGAQWHYLPDYYGKTTTVHGRFMAWIKAGVFKKILYKSIEVAIQKWGEPQCFFNDTSSIKAPFAKFAGKNPTDRGKNGIKKGVVIDWNRIILSILIDSANRHDSNLLLPHLDELSRFLDKPKPMITDSAWDSKELREELAKSNLALFAATNVRGDKNKQKVIPKGRWKMEQIFGIQHWNRGLKSCWTKTKKYFLALCQLAAAVHNFRLGGVFG